MGQSRPAKDKVEIVLHFKRTVPGAVLRVNLCFSHLDKGGWDATGGTPVPLNRNDAEEATALYP